MGSRKRKSVASTERMEQIIRDADEDLEKVRQQAPLVDRVHAYLAARVEQNGFGKEFTLSMARKAR
jgi:hypothetical protein